MDEESTPCTDAKSQAIQLANVISKRTLHSERSALVCTTKCKGLAAVLVPFHLKHQPGLRLRIHNQNITTAANAHADKKTLGHLS